MSRERRTRFYSKTRPNLSWVHGNMGFSNILVRYYFNNGRAIMKINQHGRVTFFYGLSDDDLGLCRFVLNEHVVGKKLKRGRLP